MTGDQPERQAGHLPVSGQSAPTTGGAPFTLVFLSVMIVTTVLLLANISLAVMLNSPSDAEESLINTLQTGWQVGFSAMVGLIGGRSLS
jgi:hypothetical protein